MKIFFLLVISIALFVIFAHSLQQDMLMPGVLAEGAAQALPSWFTGPFIEWITAAPGETDFSGYEVDASGEQVVNVGTVAFDGYSGPTSFACTPLITEGNTYVTSHFREYRSATYNHSGIDYGTNYQQGLNVVTPMGGKVIFKGIYGGWGYTVIIENQGKQVLLSHASEIPVSVGQTVEAGDIVMQSGGCQTQQSVGGRLLCVDEKDGFSSGAHLHYEVRDCVTNADGEVKCKALSPNNIVLPGQSGFCDWEAQIRP